MLKVNQALLWKDWNVCTPPLLPAPSGTGLRRIFIEAEMLAREEEPGIFCPGWLLKQWAYWSGLSLWDQMKDSRKELGDRLGDAGLVIQLTYPPTVWLWKMCKFPLHRARLPLPHLMLHQVGRRMPTVRGLKLSTGVENWGGGVWAVLGEKKTHLSIQPSGDCHFNNCMGFQWGLWVEPAIPKMYSEVTVNEVLSTAAVSTGKKSTTKSWELFHSTDKTANFGPGHNVSESAEGLLLRGACICRSFCNKDGGVRASEDYC